MSNDNFQSPAVDALHRQFIRIVSHQLRTPLSAIRWNLETLLEERLGPLTPTQREFLRVTDDSASEVIRRLDDLLTAIDIEEGRLILSAEPIDLAVLCASAVVDCQPRAQAKQIQFQYEKPADTLPVVAVDPTRMRDVFIKLINDAIDYTPARGVVTVRLQQKDDRIRFSVTDTGIGIPASDHPHIFERFYRGSNAHTMKQSASGISLSIVKYIVEEMGGKIGFDSQEGQGSTFWVEITGSTQS